MSLKYDDLCEVAHVCVLLPAPDRPQKAPELSYHFSINGDGSDSDTAMEQLQQRQVMQTLNDVTEGDAAALLALRSALPSAHTLTAASSCRVPAPSRLGGRGGGGGLSKFARRSRANLRTIQTDHSPWGDKSSGGGGWFTSGSVPQTVSGCRWT